MTNPIIRPANCPAVNTTPVGPTEIYQENMVVILGNTYTNSFIYCLVGWLTRDNNYQPSSQSTIVKIYNKRHVKLLPKGTVKMIVVVIKTAAMGNKCSPKLI